MDAPACQGAGRPGYKDQKKMVLVK